MTLYLPRREIEIAKAALEYHRTDMDVLSHAAWRDGDMAKSESLMAKANDIEEVMRRLRSELRK